MANQWLFKDWVHGKTVVQSVLESDENVLKLIVANDCTTLNVLKTTGLYTLSGRIPWSVTYKDFNSLNLKYHE